MSSITLTSFRLAGGVEHFSIEQAADLKRKYIAELTGISDPNQLDNNSFHPSSDFMNFLSKLPLETLQALYLVLRSVFTPACSNDARFSIVKSILGASQDEWPKLLKQICFIVPHGTEGEDIARAADILASVTSSAYREQLVLTANRLFKYDTTTIQRAAILSSLSKLDSKELSKLDNDEEKERATFVKNCTAQITQNRGKNNISATETPSLQKHEYIEKLVDFTHVSQHDHSWLSQSDLQIRLNNLSHSKLHSLYVALKDIFTPACLNDNRLSIIKLLFGVDEKEWPVLLQQVCFIMPYGTQGKDIALAMRALTSFKNFSYGEQYVNAANRYFKYDTLPIERYYILSALMERNSEDLSKLDKAGEKQRTEFVNDVVPKSLKEGARTAAIFDPILNKAWAV